MSFAVVAGVGMVPFGRHPDKTVVDMGVGAALAAIEDAGIPWGAVQTMY